MFRTALLTAAALSVSALALAACASSGPPPRGGPAPGGPGAAPARAGVFISPAGEPFRAVLNGPAPMQVWFNGADADRNGGLSRPEFQADHMRFFRLLDTNGDGFIAGPETTRYEEQIAPELLSAMDRGLEVRPSGGRRGGPPSEGGGRGGGPGSGPRLNAQGNDDTIRIPQAEPPPARGRSRGPADPPRAARFDSLFGEPEPVRAADLDLDFRVSIPEWNAMANQRFDRLDANRDGVVLYAELRVQGAPVSGGPGGGRGAGRPRGR